MRWISYPARGVDQLWRPVPLLRPSHAENEPDRLLRDTSLRDHQSSPRCVGTVELVGHEVRERVLDAGLRGAMAVLPSDRLAPESAIGFRRNE